MIKNIFKISVFIFLLSFLILSRQALAFDSSPKELKDFLSALSRQCKDLGWKDIRLQDIHWEYYRTTSQR
jgi:hypothetical protein